MFADQQIQVGVIGHPVALVGRVHNLANTCPVQPPPHVAGHVRKQQVMVNRMPDRTFGEGKARPLLPDGGVLVDQIAKTGIEGFMCHGVRLTPGTSHGAAPTG